MKHTKLKTILATIVVIFNLFVCFAGTYAWFVTVQKQGASGMQVQMYTHELDMNYNVYKYSDDDKAPINATGLPGALSLVEYDSVIKSRNENTPIIIEFLITGMALGENIPIYINTHCNETQATTHYLSNIIELKFAVIDSIVSNDVEVIYNSATSYFSNVSGVKFREGNTKTQDVIYTLSNYNASNSLRLYIQLDYSEELIDTFEFTLSDSTTTTFLNDLTLIECYTNE